MSATSCEAFSWDPAPADAGFVGPDTAPANANMAVRKANLTFFAREPIKVSSFLVLKR
jgi:hypothetical protein